MSKNKKGKIISLKTAPLSPEKYIKTQARSLPVAECLITEDWQDTGICNIIIARRHVTGNITAGIYLVDLYCLGLKDTHYEFNMSPEDYSYFKRNDFGVEECDYVLAHNIIYGAIEFADEYGFKPHKEFAVSQFILEEDDEQVELMEIDFGVDGVPCFMPGPNDDAAKIKQITATLNRTAGPGNFEIMDQLDDDEEFDEDDELNLDPDFLMEEMARSYAEFPKILKKVNKIYDALIRTPEASEIIEKSSIGKAYKISKSIVATEYNTFDSTEQEEEFYRLQDIIMNSENYDLAIKGLKKAILKYPNKPVFYDLFVPAYTFSKRYDDLEKSIIDLYKRFPDYLFAMTGYANWLIETGKANQVLAVFKGKLDLNYLYPDRKRFSVTEAASYYACMCRHFIAVDNLDAADLYMNAILKKKFTEIPGQTLMSEAASVLAEAKLKKLGKVLDRSGE